MNGIPRMRIADNHYLQRFLQEPAGDAYRKGDREATLCITLDYLVCKRMSDDAPPQLREVWMRNVRELGAIRTSPDGLATPEQERVRALGVPTLFLSGGKSAPSCVLADAELRALLPPEWCERAVFPDATHAMWVRSGTDRC